VGQCSDVTLDASASSYLSQRELNFKWSLIKGRGGVDSFLDDPLRLKLENTRAPKLNLRHTDIPTNKPIDIYEIQLTVTNFLGASSTVKITVISFDIHLMMISCY
jgi:hypothetical protein